MDDCLFSSLVFYSAIIVCYTVFSCVNDHQKIRPLRYDSAIENSTIANGAFQYLARSDSTLLCCFKLAGLLVLWLFTSR